MRHFSMKVSIASQVFALGPVQRRVLTVAGHLESMLWEVSTWTDAPGLASVSGPHRLPLYH